MKQTHEGDFEAWLREKTRAAEPEVSAEFLAAQRRGIYRRIDDKSQRGRSALRWALSLAMLLVMVAGGITFERRHKPAASISDEQLFSDLSAMEQRTEPKAIQPIHSLFEE
jgi:hypothetical protein